VPCLNITSVVPERVICNGEILKEIPFTTNDVAPNSIRFIHSDTKISSYSIAYASSDIIEILPIRANNDTLKLNTIQNYFHDGESEPDTVYIYAILDNLPSDSDCRPVGELRIIIRPVLDSSCTEDCEDGIDNNNDGKIDYADDLCRSNGPRIGIVGSDPLWKCEKTDYTFEVVNQRDGLDYSWDFGTYADTLTDGPGPHIIQFDAPTNEIPIFPEIVLTSTATNYSVTDTLMIQVRPLPQISRVLITNTTSCGGNDGGLSFEITQDTSTCFQISIDDGATWGANDETDFPNLLEGTYDVWIQYCGAECPVEYGPVEIGAPHTLKLTDDIFLNNCPGTTVENGVIGNDTIVGDTVIFRIISDSTRWGDVTIDAGGVFEYIPHTPKCGSDKFDYEVCDLSRTCCSTATVTLNFSDETPPSMSNVPIDITVSCDELIPVPDLVSASDNCPNVTINLEEKDTQGEDGCSQYQYTLTRTWIAEDLCGNTVRDSQKIEVQDFTAPSIYRIYTLPGGQKLVAGVMENVNKNWKTITFPFEFDTKPIVFTQVVTTEDVTPVNTRVRQVSTAQFELRLQEEEVNEDRDHDREEVAWFAIEPGTQTTEYEVNAGTVDIKELWSTIDISFNNTPAFFSAIQTFQDDEPCEVRYDNLSEGSVHLKIQEEKSLDDEVIHNLERVGFLAIDNIGSLIDQNGLSMGEVGSVTVDEEWKEVKTTHDYFNPVVITGGLSHFDDDPSIVRIRNVKPGSFEIKVEEWAYRDVDHEFENLSYIVIEGSIQLDNGEFCDTGLHGLEIGKDIVAIDNCDPSVTIFFEEEEVINGANLQTVRTWYVEDECGNSNGYSKVVNCSGLAIQLKLVLQGAEIENGEIGEMRDDLRLKNLVPLEEPYSSMRGFTHVNEGGGEVCSEALMAVTGNDAIVDWVFVEIRSVENADLVLATFSGLLQRDGDVMDHNGDVVIPIFNMPPGDYYVAIKHRNHIPIISLYPYTFSATEIPLIDFTNKFTPSRGNNPTIDVGNENPPVQAVWSGDLNGDGDVIFQGPGNDVFFMFLEILLDAGNEDKLTNFISEGYTSNDFNMDGTVIFQGPNNDKASLLWNTIFNHPDNNLKHPNFLVSTKRAVDNSDYQSCEINNKQDPCDFDTDGVLNLEDFDDDNDGVVDGSDDDPHFTGSDSDGDGLTDLEELNRGSNPLSACDPEPTNSNCVGIDKDQDNHFANYPSTDPAYDKDDLNTCFPDPGSANCNCPDPDQDGYVLICTGKTAESTGRTIQIKLTEWIPRQALGDVCGPCQE